jgi:PAS domain S-box-containing protein
MDFKNIVDAGISDQNPDFLNQKIGLSNRIALLNLVLVAIPFMVISQIYVPSLVYIPAMGAAFCGLAILLTHLHMYRIGRLLVAVSPLLLAGLFNAHLSGESTHTQFSLIMLSFSILPFVVYDLRERWSLAGSATINALLFLLSPWANTYFSTDFDSTSLLSGWMGYLILGLPIAVVFAIVLLMAWQNFRSDQKSRSLLEENQRQTLEVKASQEELEKNLAEIKETQEQENQRNWITQGLGNINNLVRKNEDITLLPDQVLQEIVKYQKANQGVLYILNEDEDDAYLELSAAYAYGRKKHMEGRVYPGQGLAGQCFLEKETLLLKEIPENYIKITSGLGASLPRCIIIVPLIVNEKVEGVLEVASFEEFKPHVQEYMQRVAETLASVFQMNKINLRTQRLLAESQEMTEQLRSQEEEMRQNMEELQATQEAMNRKNEEMQEMLHQAEKQKEELSEANQQMAAQEEELRQNMEEMQAQADEMNRQYEATQALSRELSAREEVLNATTIISEADVYGTIIFANDKLCEVSKYSREELIGKPHSIFRQPEMPKELFKLLWDTIQAGKLFRGIVKNRAKDGTPYWVDASIAPVLDENGKPVKYIGIRYVIEDHTIAQRLFDEQAKRMGW